MKSRIAGALVAGLILLAPTAPSLAGPDMPAAMSPEASLASMQTRPGFAIELVAAEPLVMDPISLDWGSDGKLWVVEMADYPQGVDGHGKPGGRVKFLEDTNGDGRYDKSTLFLDGLVFPSSVCPWRRGVLVAAAPDIFYAEDTDGDGKADLREVLYQGFVPGNPQHRVNGFAWGLDNWLYLANGDSGGRITSVKTGETISIGGRDLRIRPDVGSLDAQTGQSQFGRRRDDWGNWFGTSNEQPIMHFVLADHRLRRNPYAASPPARLTIASSQNTAIFPISRVISHWSGYRPPAKGEPHRFGAACSTTVYRDNLFGDAFQQNTFTCEPPHNLVHRRVLQPSGATFTSRRALGEERTEFLASTDNWFRPTSVRTGPDGALWVVDMYRQVIEHPDWIDDQVEKTLDLRAGHDKGRIFRIYPVDRPFQRMPRLDRLALPNLVDALVSSNGWQRDRVQQMLIWRGDRSVVPQLTRMATQHPYALARLHALCTLDGLNALTPETVTAAMSDRHAGIRRHATRLVERLSALPDDTARALLRCIEDEDRHVLMECAYTLGEWDDERAGRALGKMAIHHFDDSYVLAAVMSSVNRTNLDQVLAEVFSLHESFPAPGSLVRQLLTLATAMGDETVLIRVLENVGRENVGHENVGHENVGHENVGRENVSDDSTGRLTTLVAVLDALDRRNVSLADPAWARHPELRSSLERIANTLRAARRIATDSEQSLDRRRIAVQLLARNADLTTDLSVLAALLTPQSPLELQQAIVEHLGTVDDNRIPDLFVQRWRQFGYRMRNDVLDVLLSRASWRRVLLDSIEQGRMNSTDVNAARRHRLLTDDEAGIRQHAERLFSSESNASGTAPTLASLRAVLARTGDRRRGAAVFKDKCASCHRIASLGYAVGPDLLAIVDRSPTTLLTAILDPNRAVAAKYTSYNATTTRGRQYSGILRDETSHRITLVGPDGKQQTILRAQLESLTNTGKSLMPDGLENDLTHQELADVVAYVALYGAAPTSATVGDHHLVEPSDDGCLRLLAERAVLYGGSPLSTGADRQVPSESFTADRVQWDVDVVKDAAYVTFLRRSSGGESKADGSKRDRFTIDTATASLTGPLKEMNDIGVTNELQHAFLGHLYLASGHQSISMHAASDSATPRIHPRDILLVPAFDNDKNLRRRRFPGNRPQLVRPSRDDVLELPVTACEVYGERTVFEQQPPSLAFWREEGSHATWTVEVKQQNTYYVFVDYACGRAQAGTSYTIRCGEQRLSRRILSSGTWKTYRQRLVGTLELDAGVRRIVFDSSGDSDDCLIDLRSISLVPDPSVTLSDE